MNALADLVFVENMNRDTCEHFVPVELTCPDCNKPEQYSSVAEYVIQHRVQDYWLDFESAKHGYADRAKARLEELTDMRPNTSFRIVRRICTYTDEVLKT